MPSEIGSQQSESDQPFDMRALWRLGGWGAGAACALLLVAFVSASESGNQRLGLAFAPAELPVRPVTTVAVAPSQTAVEIKRLEAKIQALNLERERAAARITNLEQQLDDLTGSIKRLADVPPANAAPSVPESLPPPPQTSAAPLLKPTVSDEPSIRSPLEMPALAAATPWPEPAAPAELEKEASLNAATEAPEGEKVPMPPARVAAAEPAVQPEPTPSGFGIALAGASSLEVARMQWAAVKANFGSLLAPLQPRAVSDRRGGATHYRLVVGPLPTLNAASRLCAHIIAAHAVCEPVKYAGQPL